MPDLITRPRRLRAHQTLRNLVAESRLDRAMLVQPHFVVPGTGIAEPIQAMPGIEHQSVDRLLDTVRADLELGIRSLLLFGVPAESAKAPDGRAAWADDAVVVEAVRALKREHRRRAGRDDRRLPVRLHRPRPLRRHCATAASTTTPRCRCSPRWHWPTPAPAPTWSPPRT